MHAAENKILTEPQYIALKLYCNSRVFPCSGKFYLLYLRLNYQAEGLILSR